MQSAPEGAAVEMNSAARRRRHAAFRYGRLVMWLVSGALVVTFASYVVLPLGLTWYIPQLAARHGVHLRIERTRIEPFESTVRLYGVGVATSGQSSTRWSSIAARVDLAALAAGRLVLDDFRLSEAELSVGESIAGMDGALPGDMSIGEFVIDDVELGAISEAAGHPVAIDRLRVASLDRALRPEGTEVEASLSVGAGSARLQGRISLDGAAWILDGEVGAQEIPFEALSALLGARGSWRGRLGGAGPVRVVYSPTSGASSTTTRGRWAVDGLGFGLGLDPGIDTGIGPGIGPETGLESEPGPTRADLSVARADWNGTAFLTFSGDAVEGLSVDGELGLREPRVEIEERFDLEATELMVHIDASRTPETRVTVDGRIPTLRANGTGDAFEAVGVEAANLASRIVLTFDEVVEAEVETLTISALDVQLPADRSIDAQQITLERGVFAGDTDVVSAAAGTAARIDWRGFAGPRGTGTATRLAVEQFERRGSGALRASLVSAEAVGGRNDDSDLRLHDVGLESAAVSPTGAISVGATRIADARLADAASTLILEGLGLDGVTRDAVGTVSVESARARIVDHIRTGTWTMVGRGFDLAGGTVSDDAWGAQSVRIDTVDVGTADASWTVRGLALVDTVGGDGQVSAHFAESEALEIGSGGHRVVVESLSVDSPSWREGTIGAQAIEAASTTLDTRRRHRWHSEGWRLTGVERAASGRAGADAASLETLVLNVTDDSTIGVRGVEFGALSFDGASVVRAANAGAERAYHRTHDSTGIDLSGVRAEAVEWNGETLVAERGAAPLMSIAASAHRVSFDGVAFTSARMDTDGAHEFMTLHSESARGGVEPAIEWSTGALTLGGYRAPASGEATVESVEAVHLDLMGNANETRMRADRASARGMRVEPSGATTFADAGLDGVTVHGPRGHGGTSARAVRASPLTIRGSGPGTGSGISSGTDSGISLEIGTLSLSGVESTIAVSETGDWELPALPIGADDGGSDGDGPFTVRVREASATDAGFIVHITDRTTEPAFAERLVIEHAALRGFDRTAIGGASGGSARFSVEATAGIFDSLRADGALVPTLTGTDLDLKATVRGLSLPALSPYTRLHLGQSITRGHADVVVDATVRTSDLEAVADLTLSDVAVAESRPPASLSEPGGMEDTAALEAALEALADEGSSITIEVPLRGRLDAPGFDLDGLVARAVARAILAAMEAQPLPAGRSMVPTLPAMDVAQIEIPPESQPRDGLSERQREWLMETPPSGPPGLPGLPGPSGSSGSSGPLRDE
ncbi:MAG: DUF748 domain-containing protein [Thiotrichales bacterium]|nr:DUF748 domain-containing protein [Thiotrichales bacterium]